MRTTSRGFRHAISATAAVVLLCGATAGGQGSRVSGAAVLVRGGSFVMGTAGDAVPGLKARYAVSFPNVFENEVPAHRVTLGDFLIDATETTKEAFAAFLAARPEWRKAQLPPALHNGHYLEDWDNDRYRSGESSLPVVFVTWHAAQAFCQWAGGRLPTEAEWEFAARARRDFEFPWGDERPSPALANYGASGNSRPVAVGSYPPNALGLYDMAGNVWELLLDAWQEPYPGRSETSPIAGGNVTAQQLLSVSGRRALRGGSFGGAVVNLRTRWRDSHVVTNAVPFVGFRCAYSP